MGTCWVHKLYEEKYGNKLFSQIVVPMTHDSPITEKLIEYQTADVISDILGTFGETNAVTQFYSVPVQMELGVRMFDLRVNFAKINE